MPITSNQIKLLWVIRRKLDWSEQHFRSVLVQIGGVDSVKELDQDSFSAIIGFAEYCGFEPLTAKGRDYGARPGMASFAQIELIRTLWQEYTQGKADEDALNLWIERCWHVSSLRFLTAEAAPKAITALKAMKRRAA